MFHLRPADNAWVGYDETPDQVMAGGLLPDANSSSEEEEDEAEAMDQSDEEEEHPEDIKKTQVWNELQNFDKTLLIFPAQIINHVLIYEGGGVCAWPVARVPPGMGSLPPQTAKALAAADPELLQKQCTAICAQSVLPGIVHYSPLIALLATAAACQAAHKEGRPASSAQPVRTPRWTSWFQSALKLQQLKTAALEGVIPFHESIKPLDLKRRSLEYMWQREAADNAHDARLDALYERNATLEEHVAAWEAHALQYLHLLEHFLWSVLVAPHVDPSGSTGPKGPTLEEILTPTEPSPPLGACHAGLAVDLMGDVLRFFNAKRQRFLDHEPPLPCLLPDPSQAVIDVLRAGQEPAYKGWIPFSYLRVYAHFLTDPQNE